MPSYRLAKKYIVNKIEDFSIDGVYFIVSIIDFNSETNEQKEQHYAKMEATITALFRGEGEKIGANRLRDVQKHIRKSKYVGARNERNEQTSNREYDRIDLFETEAISGETQQNQAQSDTTTLDEGTTLTGEGALNWAKEKETSSHPVEMPKPKII